MSAPGCPRCHGGPGGDPLLTQHPGPRALLTSLRMRGSVARGQVSQEVGGHQAPPPAQLPHEEAVIVHVTEDGEDLPSPEGELHLRVHIGTELDGVVVVEGDLPLHGHVLVDVRPPVRVPLGGAAPVRLLGGGAARLLPEQLLGHSLVINLETENKILKTI